MGIWGHCSLAISSFFTTFQVRIVRYTDQESQSSGWCLVPSSEWMGTPKPPSLLLPRPRTTAASGDRCPDSLGPQHTTTSTANHKDTTTNTVASIVTSAHTQHTQPTKTRATTNTQLQAHNHNHKHTTTSAQAQPQHTTTAHSHNKIYNITIKSITTCVFVAFCAAGGRRWSRFWMPTGETQGPTPRAKSLTLK